MAMTILISKKEVKNPHPSGRPSKYNPVMVDLLEGYMRNCPDILPSKTGFANFIGVHVNTMDNWGKKHPEFLWALRRLHTLQESVLLNKGLSGQFNPTICKLLLCNNHGYRMRLDTTADSKTVKVSVIEFSTLVKKASNEFCLPIKKAIS